MPGNAARVAVSALACLRAFPRLRRRTTTGVQGSEQILGHHDGHGRGDGLRVGYGFGARRWAGSAAAAMAVREEEDVDEAIGVEGLGSREPVEADAQGALRSGNIQAIPQRVSHRYTKDGTRSPQGNSRAAASSTDARERRTHRKAQPRHPATITTTTTSTCSSPETQELIWDTEHILDQALDTSLRRGRKSTTADTPRGLPWPTRHLKLRTVRPIDVEYAETAFNAARRRFAQLESRRRRRPQDEQTRDPQHVQVLTAHINHLLYLAARIPDPEAYARIRAFLRQYDLEPDSHTFLTRLILVDKTNQVDHVGAICQKFNRRVVPPRYALNERSSRGAKTIDGEDATVLLNMTMWILAKRAQWNIVGPAYNKLLKHTPHATTHISAAFPRDYFTPSHDLSFDLYFRNTTVLDKITYQSLIRALAFHGNVVPALAVMQDLLNDSRGYSVALSDFVALFQGFARFGRIPVGWEDLEVAAYARGAQGDAVYANARDELRPPAWDDEAPDVAIKSARRDPSIFPPPIFPEPSFPGCTMTTTPSTLSGRSHKMDAIKQMTEIWAGKVNAWDQHSESPSRQHSAPTRLEREWTLVTLQQVFQSFLAISPIADAPSPLASDTSRATTKKWWEPNLAEAPSPRSIYYIMLAFSRTTDTNVSVLREVWEQLERKFGEGNEEGWTGWRLDARLRRLKQWLAVGE